MIIVQIIPSLEMGGAQKVLENLIKSYPSSEDKIVVAVFYEAESPVSVSLRNMGIEIVSIQKKPGFDISLLKKLRELANRIQPDVIHTHLYAIPYAFFALRKHPIVHTVHSIAEKEQAPRLKPICRFIYHRSRCVVVAINEFVKDSLVREYGIKSEKIVTIENGVDLSQCVHKDNYSLQTPARIINVASLSPLKNHIAMIDAVKMLTDRGKAVELMCLGDGPEREKIKAHAKELEVENQIVLKGVCSDVFPYLASADIFILPSLYEGVPMSLIEAMGTGLPCIVTNVGGAVDMVRSAETGVLIEPTAAKLADAIEDLLENEKLRKQIGESACIAAKDYASDVMAEKYRQLYQKLLPT